MQLRLIFSSSPCCFFLFSFYISCTTLGFQRNIMKTKNEYSVLIILIGVMEASLLFAIAVAVVAVVVHVRTTDKLCVICICIVLAFSQKCCRQNKMNNFPFIWVYRMWNAFHRNLPTFLSISSKYIKLWSFLLSKINKSVAKGEQKDKYESWLNCLIFFFSMRWNSSY